MSDSKAAAPPELRFDDNLSCLAMILKVHAEALTTQSESPPEWRMDKRGLGVWQIRHGPKRVVLA